MRRFTWYDYIPFAIFIFFWSNWMRGKGWDQNKKGVKRPAMMSNPFSSGSKEKETV